MSKKELKYRKKTVHTIITKQAHSNHTSGDTISENIADPFEWMSINASYIFFEFVRIETFLPEFEEPNKFKCPYEDQDDYEDDWG